MFRSILTTSTIRCCRSLRHHPVHRTMASASSSSTSSDLLDALKVLSTCEISDALTKLKHPSGGYIPDLGSFGAEVKNGERLVGEVYTVKMVDANDSDAPKLSEHFVSHLTSVDSADPGSVVFISSPHHVKSASLGGLLAAGLKVKGVKGVIIDGRCRDLAEIRSLSLPVYAKGHSTLGQSPFTRPSEVQIPLSIRYPDWPEIVVHPKDVVVADEDGVIVVPARLVKDVVEGARLGREVDAKCMQDILDGKGVKQTFAEHRGKTGKH